MKIPHYIENTACEDTVCGNEIIALQTARTRRLRKRNLF